MDAPAGPGDPRPNRRSDPKDAPKTLRQLRQAREVIRARRPRRRERPPPGAPPGARARPVRRRHLRRDRRPRAIARSSRPSTTCGGPACCPPRRASSASPGGRHDDEVPRRDAQAGWTSTARTRSIEAPWDDFSERIIYDRGDFTDPAAYERLAARLDHDRCRSTRLRGQPALLPGHPAVELSGHRRATWRAGARPRAPRRPLDAASSSRSPSATTSPARAELNREVCEVFNERADLPHRPLPGQGDGPEHPGLPLRQRHLRADLEPPLRRPRADHRGRDRRRRGPRRLLRGGRRPARHGPEPPAAARWHWWRWSRPATFEADAVRDEKVKVLRAIRPLAADDVARHVVRGQYGAGLRSTASRCPATGRSRASTRTRRPRPTSPLRADVDNWRWAGVPFYLRTGKRLPKRVDRDRHPVQARAASSCSGMRHATPTRTCSPCASSPTRASCCGSRPRCRTWAGVRTREDGLHVRRPPSNIDAPEAYETLLLDAMPGRRFAVHACRRGRGRLEHRRSDHRHVGIEPSARVRQLRRRHVGPDRSRQDDLPRRQALATGRAPLEHVRRTGHRPQRAGPALVGTRSQHRRDRNGARPDLGQAGPDHRHGRGARPPHRGPDERDEPRGHRAPAGDRGTGSRHDPGAHRAAPVANHRRPVGATPMDRRGSTRGWRRIACCRARTRPRPAPRRST